MLPFLKAKQCKCCSITASNRQRRRKNNIERIAFAPNKNEQASKVNERKRETPIELLKIEFPFSQNYVLSSHLEVRLVLFLSIPLTLALFNLFPRLRFFQYFMRWRSVSIKVERWKKRHKFNKIENSFVWRQVLNEYRNSNVHEYTCVLCKYFILLLKQKQQQNIWNFISCMLFFLLLRHFDCFQSYIKYIGLVIDIQKQRKSFEIIIIIFLLFFCYYIDDDDTNGQKKSRKKKNRNAEKRVRLTIIRLLFKNYCLTTTSLWHWRRRHMFISEKWKKCPWKSKRRKKNMIQNVCIWC